MLGFKPEPYDALISVHDINSVTDAPASVNRVTAGYIVPIQNVGSLSPPLALSRRTSPLAEATFTILLWSRWFPSQHKTWFKFKIFQENFYLRPTQSLVNANIKVR